MLPANRATALIRSPAMASKPSTSPLQRLSAQSWRSTTRSTPPHPFRTLHTRTTGGSTTAAKAGAPGSAPSAWWLAFSTRSAWRSSTNATGIHNLLARTRQRRNFSWSWARRSQTGTGAQAEESLSLSGRLRKLSREYGWSAVGVYLGLSVLDFPFCFLLVKWAGTERIAAIEEWILSNVKKFVPEGVKEWWHEWRATVKDVEKQEIGDNHITQDLDKIGWGVEEAQQRHKADASLATQLALAYAIHKSFIFVRVPLTAAVTPKVVKVLRSWGWQIGKRKPKTGRGTSG